jgi:O-antigen/teichoic acid export membrane protein
MLTKLWQKINNKHFFSLSGNASVSLLAMVSFAIIYRVLPSDAAIGAWVFFQTLFTLLETFRSGFLNTAIITFYAGNTDARKQEVIASCWYIGGIITFGLTAITLVCNFLQPLIDNQGVKLFLWWGGLTFITGLPAFIAAGLVQAQNKFDRFLYIRFSNQALFISFLLFIHWQYGVTLQWVAIANITSNAIVSIACLLLGWSGIEHIKYKTKQCVKELYDFGKYSFGSYLSSSLFRVTDNMIINFMLGDRALAIYNLGVRLMEVVEIPLRSFAATGMSELAACFNQNDKNAFVNTLRKYIGLVTTALLPALVMAVLLAGFVIPLIGGNKNIDATGIQQASNVMRIYMTFALLYPADRFYALGLDVIKKPKINFMKVLAMLAANVIADFVGVYFFGSIYGIALGTLMPILIGLLVGYKYLQQYQPFNFWSVFTTGPYELKQLVLKMLGKR